MFRVNRHGRDWQAASQDSRAVGATPLDALRSLKKRETGLMERTRRWVLYAALDERGLTTFGDAVTAAGTQWKPLAVSPLKVDEAIKVLQPEMVVVQARTPADEAFLRRTHALHCRQRLVIDDRQLAAVSKLLSAAPAAG